MNHTPKKLVHWALEFSNSPYGSPFSESPSTDSVTSTSTLQYVNSQLIAHGFTQAPGLSLDGLSNSDSEKVVKCLMGMLSQRMEDMNRTEDLSTKYRTLSYDRERLESMHRAATEKTASAEREASTQKSKLATLTRTLQQTEAAHKHTTGELQRTRTTLQTVRTTHQAELKKKEKEVERMAEKWTKLSDSQLKLGSVASGMSGHCANADVAEGRPDAMFSSGKGLVDAALEQAEEACKELREENKEVKALIVDVANAIQKILHKATRENPDDLDYPPPFGTMDLFPLGPPDFAFEKLSSLLTALRNAVGTIKMTSEEPPASAEAESSAAAEAKSKVHAQEVEKLKKQITTLRSELEQAQKETSAYATQAQAVFDRFSTNPQLLLKVAETEEATSERMEQLHKELSDLEHERAACTEAAMRLGKERADLEAERMKFMEERRAWQVQVMLDDPPAKPAPSEPEPITQLPPVLSIATQKSPRKPKVKIHSPRKSPVKATSGKRARTTVFRRSSSGSGLSASTQSKVVPSFETEVIPPLTGSLLPTSFVLPPPSPQSRIPPRSDDLLGPFATAKSEPSLPTHAATALPTSKSEAALPDASSTTPQTPMRRPFPMAKPFAPRMMHAYSPSKPSPLSRILMLSDSPEGGAPDPAPAGLQSVSEDEEPVDPAPPVDEESPLREKKLEKNVDPALPECDAPRKSRSAAPPPKKRLATSGGEKEKEKGKARAAGEKENTVKRALLGPPPAKSASAKIQAGKSASSSGAAAGAKARFAAKLPPGKGGARRVPVDSAEAGPGWRG